MPRFARAALLFATTAALPLSMARADEGMWTFDMAYAFSVSDNGSSSDSHCEPRLRLSALKACLVSVAFFFLSSVSLAWIIATSLKGRFELLTVLVPSGCFCVVLRRKSSCSLMALCTFNAEATKFEAKA